MRLSEDLLGLAVIALLVGLLRMDDQSRAHLRLGYAALGLGALLLAGAIIAYVAEERPPTRGDDDS